MSNNNEETEEWLFDSIVGYLSSPIWRNPIEHFFEQNCTIFSPDEGKNASSIPAEYLGAHLNYKNLVDALINTFLQDLGITYKQFLNACIKSTVVAFSGRQQSIYMDLFEQIWATENINLFKSQMIKKNVELELQSLILLQFQLGIKSKKVTNSGQVGQRDEDEIMAIVIRKSMDEYGNCGKSMHASELETAKQISKEYEDIEKSLQHEIDQQAYLNRKAVKQELKNPNPIKSEETPISACNSGVRTRPGSAQKVYLNNNNNESDQNELLRRGAFMQKQRDLLTEKKRTERAKQLENYMAGKTTSQHNNNGRPMSSRAARSVLNGGGIEEIDLSSQGAKSVSDEERKRIEARRVLADTLKREVISQSKR